MTEYRLLIDQTVIEVSWQTTSTLQLMGLTLEDRAVANEVYTGIVSSYVFYNRRTTLVYPKLLFSDYPSPSSPHSSPLPY